MKKILVFSFFLLLLYAPETMAFQKEVVPDTEAKGDFVLGGGKTELELAPGEEANGEISITNRMGKETEFILEVEDFAGSKNPEDTSFNFLGDQRSPYSLKDSIIPEVNTFSLRHGERIIVPVKITIPKDAEPGGRYGSLLVMVKNPEEQVSNEPGKAKSQVKIISRLAALFYVRIKGQAREEGALKNFTTDRVFYEKGPVDFKILYENTGNIHLKPAGNIEITNILGKKVGEASVEEFFVLPDSVREKKVSWNRGMLIGYYTANLSLQRGYNDQTDVRSIHFWVIPWKLILAIFIFCVATVWLFYWIMSKFEIRRK